MRRVADHGDGLAAAPTLVLLLELEGSVSTWTLADDFDSERRLLVDLSSRPDLHRQVLTALDAELERLEDPTAAADAAGRHIIEAGRRVGETVAEVAAGPRGERWIRWAIQTPEFPASRYAKIYAQVYLPHLWAEVDCGH